MTALPRLSQILVAILIAAGATFVVLNSASIEASADANVAASVRPAPATSH